MSRRNYVHAIATGRGGTDSLLGHGPPGRVFADEQRRDLAVSSLERNIVQSAIARNPFYAFAGLRLLFPHLASIQEFVRSEAYLGGLTITFQGNLYGLEDNRRAKLDAMIGLLAQLETEIRNLTTEYRGSHEFRAKWIRDVFLDKLLKFDRGNERGREDPQFDYFVSDKDWFAFKTIPATSEEKAFVRMLDRQIADMKEKYDGIYLLRNEGHLTVYGFTDGQAFEPDFLLFLRDKAGALLTYQLFMEPKGPYLAEHDRWKEQFLEEISKEYKDRVLVFGDGSKYRLIGLPFYSNEDENRFQERLASVMALGVGVPGAEA